MKNPPPKKHGPNLRVDGTRVFEDGSFINRRTGERGGEGSKAWVDTDPGDNNKIYPASRVESETPLRDRMRSGRPASENPNLIDRRTNPVFTEYRKERATPPIMKKDVIKRRLDKVAPSPTAKGASHKAPMPSVNLDKDTQAKLKPALLRRLRS